MMRLYSVQVVTRMLVNMEVRQAGFNPRQRLSAAVQRTTSSGVMLP